VGKRSSKGATAQKLDDPTTSRERAGARGLSSVTGGGSTPLALDRVIHEHVRLAIVSALAVNEVLTFNDLKQLLDASDGNLSVHARRLEEAGYVSCRKTYDGRIPRTEYRLTAAGRRALERYLAHMEALIKRVGGE
jgi:DNA-binding HxlR family transcriptional regulator